MRRLLVSLAAAALAATSCQNVLAAPVCLTDNKYSQSLNLPIYEWVDRTKTRKGTIVAVHGLTLYARCWDQFATRLAARGYHVYSIDQRGFGAWMTQASKYGGTNKIELAQSRQDLLDLVTTLRQAHPKEKLFCLGESLGSNMILMLLEDHPELADGAILGSPCYKTRMHPKPLHWAADAAKELVRPNKPLNLEPYSAPYLSNDPAVSAACNSDPMINRKMTPAELVKVDIMDDKAINEAKKLPAALPILIVAGTQDAMFHSTDLPKEVEKWGSKDVSVNLLPGKGHLLMEHQAVNPQVAALVDRWLAQQTLGGTLATAPAKPNARKSTKRTSTK